MSYKSDLQANNVDLQSILDTINSLPEAESGGGSSTSNVKPCMLTITNNFSDSIDVVATVWGDTIVGEYISLPRGDSINIKSICGGVVHVGNIFSSWEFSGVGIRVSTGFEGKIRAFIIESDVTSANLTLNDSLDIPEP